MTERAIKGIITKPPAERSLARVSGPEPIIANTGSEEIALVEAPEAERVSAASVALVSMESNRTPQAVRIGAGKRARAESVVERVFFMAVQIVDGKRISECGRLARTALSVCGGCRYLRKHLFTILQLI
jgi:hypothetical protein